MPTDHNFPVLESVIIGTSNLEKAKAFYVSVFGITIENEEPHYISAKGVDGTHIELEEDTEHRFPHWAERNIGTFKNSEFRVADIHSFLERVVQHGGTIITKPVLRPWGYISAEFADPDGNIVLVSQKNRP